MAANAVRLTVATGLLALTGLLFLVVTGAHGSTQVGTAGARLNGDINCNESVDAVDALGIQREIAALPVNQQPDCPAIGEALARLSAGLPNLFGDVDCNGLFDTVDSLKVLRWIAALAILQEEGCPEIGTSGSSPTETPGATATTEPTSTTGPTPGATPGPDCEGQNLDEPIPIPDGSPGAPFAEVAIEIDAPGVVEQLWLCVNIDHEWVGDLLVRLDAPHGSSTTLIDRPGYPFTAYGCDGLNVRVLLDDSAAESVHDQCNANPPAIDGTFRPSPIALSFFDGQVIDGTWRVQVYDMLQKWTGEITGAALWYEVSQ